MGRKLRKNTFYGIWDTENECLDSNEAYYDLEEAQEVCDSRNRQLRSVEFTEDGYAEYVGELPAVYEVRKITAEVVTD
jgi:hypothetical protein